MTIPEEYHQGDQVRLITTRRVSYISHPPGDTISPKGVWIVAAGVNNDLMLTKSSATIIIPASDVQMYRKREPDALDTLLRGIIDGERQRSESTENQS